ncbi:ABC-2 type transport system permease protein [Kitasatospora sp. MAP12-15]|uniref:ABC transporter permease n=1 Tax=unclassified Kitasatospora TaxID=2633591 RepID=UPI0024772ACF|nr:ABC transporter permease [Kitasatospora sp. MAP12-44]MDH6112073.1 ABC-2 type transport system permease protein [Kitasatospora sp. MAP12-44]
MSLPPDTSTATRDPRDPRDAEGAGVIHDIGYRGYQGPRLGRSYATRSLYVQGLRGAFGLGRSGKSKVLPMLIVAMMVLPAGVLVAITVILHRTDEPVDYPRYLSVFGLFVQIFLAAQAPVLLSRDLRYNTVPLYFSRPITRGDYVRAKGAAMVVATFIVTVLPLLVLYLGAPLAGLNLRYNTEHLGYGLLAAALYSVVLSAVSLVIAASMPRRGIGVAAIMSFLVISEVVAVIIQGISGGLDSASSSANSGDWAYLISPTDLVERFVNHVCGLTHGELGGPDTPGTLGALVFGLEMLLIVAGAYLLLLRRYRKI